MRILLVHRPHKNANATVVLVRQTRAAVACTFKQMPDGLQKQAFLRVGQIGSARGIAKEPRIKAVHICQKATPFALRGAWRASFVGIGGDVVQTVVRGLCDTILSSAQRLGKRLYTVTS